VPGKRAIVDLEPSPEDVRRLYTSHRDAFDLPLGARFAYWQIRPVDLIASDGLRWDEAATRAKTKAQAILVDFARDRDVDRVGGAFGLKRGADYGAVPAGEFRERAQLPPQMASVSEWVFADGRVAGDATVIETPGGDLLAVAVMEMRPARTRSFAEVQEALLVRIRRVRQVRFEVQHTIELLARAQIWPTRLAGLLEDKERDVLARIDRDPVDRDIRLR
jgi:hypothetical protein